MLKRIVSGVVGLPILILLVISGGIWLQTALGLIILIGLWEFYSALSKVIKPIHYLGFVFAVLHIVIMGRTSYTIMLTIPIVLSITALTFAVIRHGTTDIFDCAITTFGYIYVVLTLSSIYFLREWQGGGYEVWLIFIAAWGCDTGAYFFGKAFGKRKLAPALSPAKTIAGSVGGTITASVLGAAYGLILYNLDVTYANYALGYALVTFACSVFAQIGDLAASSIKRHTGKKDFGNIMPGHGGVLDRFDSIIFAAPAAYIMLLIFSPLFGFLWML